MKLRLALVGGPMYDGLYDALGLWDDPSIDIVVHADHPTLNRAVAEIFDGGGTLDVISTHSKYAPSQRAWLRCLDDVVDVTSLAPRAVSLCRFGDTQYCVPRNIDVRVLWANRLLCDVHEVPATWRDLALRGLAFGFPGRESGLFGTLFEIVTAFGGRLFDGDARLTFVNASVIEALECLARIGKNGPSAMVDWHYDEVDAAVGRGELALAAAWPGGTVALRESAAGPDLVPSPYFGDASGARSYAGCHAWAIPCSSGDEQAALDLVQRLCSLEAHTFDAASGTISAHVAAMAAIEPIDAIDAQRLAITASTIANGMLTYPPMERFFEVEDAAWGAIHSMLVGNANASDTARIMQRSAEEALR